MSSTQRRHLDQALDTYGSVYQRTAEDYAMYLGSEYGNNADQRHENWRTHFGKMHARYNEHIMQLLETGYHRSDLGIAVIGPGFTPIGRDFGNTGSEAVLEKVRHVVCIDFSTEVVRRAVENILSNTRVSSDSLFPMQFDVTGGFSTAYAEFLKRNFNCVQDIESMLQATEAVENLCIDDMRDQLLRVLDEIEEGIEKTPGAQMPEILIGGGWNMARQLNLSVDGEPLEIQSWYLPMVLAGTGAAVEDVVWSRFEEVEQTVKGSKESIPELERIIKRIQRMISKYNTIVSELTIGKILKDNPNSKVLAVSDVSTMHNRYSSLGPLARLNLETLESRLAAMGIIMDRMGIEWEWHDDVRHYHGVNAFTFKKEPSQVQKLDQELGDEVT